MESGLLNQTDIDRLLGASSGEEAVKMLRDIGFIEIPENDSPFQDILDATAAKIKDDVERMAPEDKRFIFHTLWIYWDRPRIAYELKKKHGFTSEIAFPPTPPISANFNPALEQSFDSPKDVDDAVAAACNEEAVRLAKMSRSYVIYTYIIRIIDVERMQAKNRSENNVGDAITFEKEMVESLREMLNDMSTMFLGPEPVFSYAARAMNHLMLLRVLLTGKVNKLEIQEIKSLLPPLL